MSAASNTKAKSTASIAYKAILGIVGITGLILNFGVLQGKFDLNQVNYFTVLSNVMVDGYLIAFFIHYVRNKDTFDVTQTVWCPAWKYSAMTAIFVTFLVAHFLLGGGFWYDDNGNFLFQTPILHYILPIGFVLDWVIFDKKGNIKPIHIAAGLLMPVVYLAYVMIRVNVFNSSFNLVPGSRYPYGFLDLDILPLSAVIFVVIALVVIFVAIGIISYLVDHFLARRAQKRQG